MPRQLRVRRLLIAGLAAAVLVLASPLGAGAAVIEGFVTSADAARGLGWAIHPDQTAGGTERLVEGPLTPPSGRGSLEMTAKTAADRALIFTVPKPSNGVPPGNIATFIASPWATLTGSSFSTFTTDTATPGASLPVLRLIGYQAFDADKPAQSTGFTTLNFEGAIQTPVPAANAWQTWTLDNNALVWQSNTTGGFCLQAAPCTLSQFAAQYTDGAWGQIQVGIGSGAPPNATGYVDNVKVTDGTTTFVADFEIPGAPAEPASTATIAAGAATATGGKVAVTLNSSPLAALGSTPFTITFSGTSAGSPPPVTVPAGKTGTQSFDLPFGTTQVTVQAQGVTLASAPITFQAPTTTTTTTTTAVPPSTPPAAIPAAGTTATGTTSAIETTSGTGAELSFSG